MLSVLDEHGNLVGPEPDLGGNDLIRLYRLMATARAYDEKCLNLARQGRIPAYYPAIGQEAVVASVFPLDAEDWIFTAYREPGVWLARGLPVDVTLSMWHGHPDDRWDVRGYGVTRLNPGIGTQLPHATGFSYAQRLLGGNRVAVVYFGDGATSSADFHSGLNFAGVWKTPTVFFCQNNQYAESTPLRYQTASPTLAQKADAYGFPGVLVDGMDPLAVHEATSEAVRRARSGDGPTLIEALTYRFTPHSTYDGMPVYRTREEEQEWAAKDPLTRLRAHLQARGLWRDGLDEEVAAATRDQVDRAIDALDDRPLPGRAALARHLFSRAPKRLVEQIREADGATQDPSSSFRDEEVFHVEEERRPGGPTGKMTLVEVLRAALDHAMAHRPNTVILGEDVGLEGGIFRVTDGLLEKYGGARVIDTPLCETGIVGTAVGMAMAGLRPVAEVMFGGFLYPALDQLVSHVSRMRWRTRGGVSMPILIRLAVGGGHKGAESHSDSPEALLVHTPGLFVVIPSTPYDAKGLLAAALEGDDPVLFLEPTALYQQHQDAVPLDHYTIPIGRGKVARRGSDATVVTYGNCVGPSLDAAGTLEQEGISCEVIDLRTLYPWDEDLVLSSVERTGRLVTVQEAPLTLGMGAEIAATVAEKAAYALAAPVVRVGHPDVHWGPLVMEQYSLVRPDRVARAVRRVMTD